MLFCDMLILFEVILEYFDIFVISEKADRVALAAGQEPQLSERIFLQKTRILITYSAVTASGTACCDPPRHVDVIIHRFIKIRLM